MKPAANTKNNNLIVENKENSNKFLKLHFFQKFTFFLYLSKMDVFFLTKVKITCFREKKPLHTFDTLKYFLIVFENRAF